MSIPVDNDYVILIANSQRFVVKNKENDEEIGAISISLRYDGKNEYYVDLNKRIYVKYMNDYKPTCTNQYIPVGSYASFEECMNLLKKYERESSEGIKHF